MKIKLTMGRRLDLSGTPFQLYAHYVATDGSWRETVVHLFDEIDLDDLISAARVLRQRCEDDAGINLVPSQPMPIPTGEPK